MVPLTLWSDNHEKAEEAGGEEAGSIKGNIAELEHFRRWTYQRLQHLGLRRYLPVQLGRSVHEYDNCIEACRLYRGVGTGSKRIADRGLAGPLLSMEALRRPGKQRFLYLL
jgi:hypothetical protein